MNYQIQFPDEFSDNDLMQFEVEAKGYLMGVSIIFEGYISYNLAFYDSARLKQDIEEELQRSGYFFKSNLIVVPKVTRDCMQKAIDDLFASGEFKWLKHTLVDL
jgi:hypothetical protein